MTYISMNDGSGHECSIAYATLRSVFFEKSSATAAGLTRGPGNPPAWIELDASVMPHSGRTICITPNGVSALSP